MPLPAWSAACPTTPRSPTRSTLTFFSRFPTDEERGVAASVTWRATLPIVGEAAEDLAWSLMNSLEFLFNH